MRQTIVSGDDGTVGIADPRLRQRVGDAVSSFSRCLDAAIAGPAQITIDDLRDATNHLMRAGARVLLELERSAGSVD